jgi:hypothetical protein
MTEVCSSPVWLPGPDKAEHWTQTIRLSYAQFLLPSSGLGNRDPRLGKPRPTPYSALLQLILARSSQELGESAKLAGVVWNELECGGVEHNMSTVPLHEWRGRGRFSNCCVEPVGFSLPRIQLC